MALTVVDMVLQEVRLLLPVNWSTAARNRVFGPHCDVLPTSWGGGGEAA